MTLPEIANPIAVVHALAASVGLLAVPAVFVLRKGTAVHRAVGGLYVLAMAGTLGTAFFIFDMTGGPNAFHVLAVVGTVSLVLGLRAIRRYRRTGDPGALMGHFIHMSYSALGLWMAFLAQIAVNPLWGLSPLVIETFGQFWIAVAAVSVVLYGLGSWAIFGPGQRLAKRYAGIG